LVDVAGLPLAASCSAIDSGRVPDVGFMLWPNKDIPPPPDHFTHYNKGTLPSIYTQHPIGPIHELTTISRNLQTNFQFVAVQNPWDYGYLVTTYGGPTGLTFSSQSRYSACQQHLRSDGSIWRIHVLVDCALPGRCSSVDHEAHLQAYALRLHVGNSECDVKNA
jgi:hypothetical protein